MLVLRAQNAEIGVLGLRGFKLSFGLGHRFVGINARLIQNLGQIERFLVSDHGGIQQLLQSRPGREASNNPRRLRLELSNARFRDLRRWPARDEVLART